MTVGPVEDLSNFAPVFVRPKVPDNQAADRAYALLADTQLPPVIPDDALEDY